ncbi:MAG TPA: hypothetical protein HA254_02060 [Candidatus Diapherotrites archaeon]|uniref:HAD family hydrolase n=1 Tax=Candidatus Iainarchaeum sp. TaxID=3101447 RepID=A0A7J4IV83_9ARCH|nr:hypothetical protein [Candidatus Diapherotrites archaeon]
MRFPRVKQLRSKLSSAKLLGIVAKNSLQFKLRRTALKRFRSRERQFTTIIVDMDGTLYDTDASLEGLSICFPRRWGTGVSRGEKIYESMISKIAAGESTIEQAIIEGNTLFVKRGFQKKNFSKVLARIKPRIRKPLVMALRKLKSEGKTIVLATLSSREFALLMNSYLKKRFDFEFDLVVGTELEYQDGRISGVKSIVGTKDFEINGVPVRSKLSAVREELALIGKGLDVNTSALITDSYGDIDLAKMLVTILIKPDEPSMDQRVSQRLKLADFIVDDGPGLEEKLVEIILGAS